MQPAASKRPPSPAGGRGRADELFDKMIGSKVTDPAGRRGGEIIAADDHGDATRGVWLLKQESEAVKV